MVKIFVGNLNPESKAADLRKKFETFGKVTECDIVNNFGFVHMEKDSDATAAISGLQNCILDGAKINVERSRGKRSGGGAGPIRRRGESRYREERPRGPLPPRYMNSGPPPPPPRMGRYAPYWDDGYNSYAPRGSPRSYDYPTVNSNGRYHSDRDSPIRSVPRGYGREPLPPPPGSSYRGQPMPDPLPPRDYPPKSLPRSYDAYAEYDRYREPLPSPQPRSMDYYDNYGSYSSGGYEDGDRVHSVYESSYDYGYYDYGVGNRSPLPPSRSGYTYGRP